jgi:hypothetical protein
MRVLVLGGLLMLAACGGGGTTGTNYSEAPPVAEIVATPTPRPSATPTPEAETPAAAENTDLAADNSN